MVSNNYLDDDRFDETYKINKDPSIKDRFNALVFLKVFK